MTPSSTNERNRIMTAETHETHDEPPPGRPSDIVILKAAVHGVYDLQKLRIAAGLRLCANFRAKLKLLDSDNADDDEEDDEETKIAKKIIKKLKEAHRRLTDGIAKSRGRRLTDGVEDGRPLSLKDFKGNEIISTVSEAVLFEAYLDLEKDEAKQFRQLEHILNLIPIYTTWLRRQEGVGPAMAGVLIAYLDPYKARHGSAVSKYAGLHVGPDGMGRSRRAEHMVEREYLDKNKELKIRNSLTYEPFLKTKLTGVLAGSFLRANKGEGAQPWRKIYDDYKHRLETDPSRPKVSLVKWKALHKAEKDVSQLWPPGRINNAAKRYMVKIFLSAFWSHWRELEGLPVTDPYPVDKMGLPPHGRAA